VGRFPINSYPRIKDRIGWFEARAIWTRQLAVAFDPVIFFGYTKLGKRDGVSPKEVLEVERAGGEGVGFVKSVDEVWGMFPMILEQLPTVVLEVA